MSDPSSDFDGELSSAAVAAGAGATPRHLESIMRIPVGVQVMLGSTVMPVADLMKLAKGAIVPLDHGIGEPVDVLVNGRVVARGEMVVLDDDPSRLGVRLTEIVGSANHFA
jgi:flagellar motor switch protein FliN/FliY